MFDVIDIESSEGESESEGSAESESSGYSVA